jgi:6-phosphogluconolactonase (cycloisomerase 2 family)
MRWLIVSSSIVLALAVPVLAASLPRGALTQGRGTAGCFVGAAQPNGCAAAKGTAGLYTVALSPDGRSAYASAQYSEGISSFRRDPKTGALRQQGCIAQSDRACLLGNGMHGAFWTQVAPDGADVYLTASDDSSIALLRRDPTTGALTQQGCLINSGGAQNASKGCMPIAAFNTPREFAISRDGRFLYVATFTTQGVAILARDPATGLLTQPPSPASCVREGGGQGCAKGFGLRGPTGVAISRDGASVYVTSFKGDGVVAFARDGQTGALTELGCLNQTGTDGCHAGRGLGGAYGIAVAPDGRDVYVASRKSRALVRLRRDPATGALAQPAGTQGCVADSQVAAAGGCATGKGLFGARGVDVSPDGRFVYAGAYSADAVTAFARDGASGGLRQLAGPAGCVTNKLGRNGTPTTPGCTTGRGLNGAWGVTVSPDGRDVYVGAQINNGIAIFRRRP